MEEKKSGNAIISNLLISAVVSAIIKASLPELTQFAVFGAGLFIYFGLSFHHKLGSGIPVRELIILIALIQWVIAPIFSYHIFTESEFYYMIIEEEQYMSFVVPATISMITGLMLPLPLSKENSAETRVENPEYYLKRGRIILSIGLLSFILRPFVPASMAYFFLLLSYSAVLGAFYMLKANAPYKYLILLLALAPIFSGAVESSVFHEMFIWGGFLVIIQTYINKSNFIAKTILLGAMVTAIFVLNAAKKDYREALWAEKEQINIQGNVEKNDDKGSASQLIGVVNEKVKNEGIKSDYYQELTDRLNQGWIIARIMYVVPLYEPYAEGQTIMEGINAALLPRFLSPNKAMSGGGKNFERFTGLPLAGASMNLGIIGEAYANYGEVEGVLFMFVYGFFFNIVYWIILKRAHDSPEFLLWLPFLFFYVIKAEEDFTSIFNQFIKSVMVMIMFMYILNFTVNDEPFLKRSVETP